MQNDLISRSALLEVITFDRKAAKVHPQEICERFERFCDYAETLVEQTPTVDAAPVRHGRWTFPWTSPECSACRKTQKWTSKYCPNCGAKMDAEVE